ncbi:tubulin-specific chaperone A isoform X1 [Hydra vulgaris]|nr:tubulin-specific chaperone A [Hydra vulgaris]
MSSQDQRVRQLKIKTGIVQRLHKEKKVYEKELIQQEENILKMKNDGADEYDIRKQVEVKNESAAMIPDSIRRLKKACDDLVNLLETENDLSEVEEYIAAQNVLQEATAELN